MSDSKASGGGGLAVRAGSVRNGSLGRFVAVAGADTLTEQQRAFVEAFCSNGGNARRACEDAGYLSPHAPSRLLGLTQVRHAVGRTLERKIQGEGASLAWGVVQHLLRDPATPSAVRFQAAKWTLEASGLGVRQASGDGGKPLAEMTLADLEATVTASRQALDALAIDASEGGEEGEEGGEGYHLRQGREGVEPPARLDTPTPPATPKSER